MAIFEGRWVRWLGNALAVLVLLLGVAIAVFSAQNRELQDKVTAERANLSKAQTLATIDNNLIQLLAKTAAEKNDTALQALLARNGVTFQIDPAAAQSKNPQPQPGARATP